MTDLICLFLGIYLLILLVRIVMSWFPIPHGGAAEQFVSVLHAVTEPVLGPLRAMIPPVRIGAAYLDLSPLIVFFGIQILRGFIC